MAKVFDIWIVAAAVLLRDGGSMHFQCITDAVRKSGLTKLGNKGDTSGQTMGSILREQKAEGKSVFGKAKKRGYYQLANTDFVKEMHKVQEVLALLPPKG
jgi:hypothetical protein